MDFLKKHWFILLGWIAILMAMLLQPAALSAQTDDTRVVATDIWNGYSQPGTPQPWSYFQGTPTWSSWGNSSSTFSAEIREDSTGTPSDPLIMQQYRSIMKFAVPSSFDTVAFEFTTYTSGVLGKSNEYLAFCLFDGSWTGTSADANIANIAGTYLNRIATTSITTSTKYVVTFPASAFTPSTNVYIGVMLYSDYTGSDTLYRTGNSNNCYVTMYAEDAASTAQRPALVFGGVVSSPPDAPTELSASWDYGSHGSYLETWLPELDWTDNSDDESYWEFQISDNDSFITNVATSTWYTSPPGFVMFAMSGGSLVDWTAWEADTLYFRVRAVNEYGESDWSGTATLATFEGYEDLVQKPVNLTATLDSWSIGVAEMYGIVLEWDNPNPSGTGYLVQRASNNLFSQNVSYYDNTSNNNFGKGNLGISETAFSDWWYIHNLGPVTWYYRVMAINPLGSNEVTLTTSIQFGGQVTYATIIGSEWSNVASCVLDATDIEDIEGSGVIPPGTTPPTVTEGGTGNPFSGMTWFNEPWFPYAAMFVLMLTAFGVALYLSRDRKMGVIFGGVGASVVMGIFITLNWINGLIIMALLIAVAIIFLLPKVVGR